MRVTATVPLLFWLFAATDLVSPLPAPGAEEARIAGKEYQRVSDWARNEGFTLRWLRRDETLELNNPAAVIVLQVHSPEAQINGVGARLLFPLVQKGATVWISKMDIRSTFEPVLAPPRLRHGVALKS